ncbi:hypothetical protein C0993_009899 [Termitomyces sp. T159_Od127]|nr:hypothetical protein C0993_009899 [Termitomyces sp. T159_Od127]
MSSQAAPGFADLYDALPPDTQRTLLETHSTGTPLLPRPAPAHPAVLSHAAAARARFLAMPRLDLTAKKREIDDLMHALHHDAKLAVTRDSSIRDELLAEAVDSLTAWLNDIWSVAFEFRGDFRLAHACLLLTADAAASLADVPVLGCKCALINMPIDVRIRARDGTPVRAFVLRGTHTLANATLWIWRDLFVAMLAHATPRAQRHIPAMIADIEALMGWEALPRLLHGGKSCVANTHPSESDYDFDSDSEPDEYVFPAAPRSTPPTPPLHAPHWPPSLSAPRARLHELIQARLHTLFRALPSLALYTAIRALALDPAGTESALERDARAAAQKSPDARAGALAVCVARRDARGVVRLLGAQGRGRGRGYADLEGACDDEVLRGAVRVLIDAGAAEPDPDSDPDTDTHPHPHALARDVLAASLLRTARAAHAALLRVFGAVDDAPRRREVEEVLMLPAGAERAERVRRWVEGVCAEAGAGGPPGWGGELWGGGGEGEGWEGDGDGAGGDAPVHAHDDPAVFLEHADAAGAADADWDALREEFCPPLGGRFERGCEVAGAWCGGDGHGDGEGEGGGDGGGDGDGDGGDGDAPGTRVLRSVYVRVVADMPYLAGEDLVECLVERAARRRRGRRGRGRAAEGAGAGGVGVGVGGGGGDADADAGASYTPPHGAAVRFLLPDAQDARLRERERDWDDDGDAYVDAYDVLE